MEFQRTDESLWAEFRKDPTSGFEPLYRRFAGPLLRFTYRFCGSREVAEEILHDVFAELLRGSYRELPTEGLKGWLYTLARNKSLNHRRRADREVASEKTVAAAIDETDLERNFAMDRRAVHLRIAENALPPDLAETWALRREGLGYEEIAERLAIPLGTVKSRFHRLVNRLKEELKHESSE